MHPLTVDVAMDSLDQVAVSFPSLPDGQRDEALLPAESCECELT
jgi:hypothetical protein